MNIEIWDSIWRDLKGFYSNNNFLFEGLGTAIIVGFFVYIFKNTSKIFWTNVKSNILNRSERLPNDLFTIIPEPKLNILLGYLKQKIYNINENANWTSENYTPLDAEIEVRKGSSKKKVINDLTQAIKYDKRSTVFLVLGDPGSGKSVALRKLSEELLNEINIRKTIPIYINLKEWSLINKWSLEHPPTPNQLQEFILKQLWGHSDLIDSILDSYFFKLLNNGSLFLILDSFDEIPMVLDENEHSWLIDKLSEVIFTTIKITPNSKGILASRFFRKPSKKFKSDSVLFIRPFNDYKIFQTLHKSVNFTDKLVKELFNVRTDLIPIVRNPFSASLLSNYLQNTGNLPNNQAALYENYIETKLELYNKYNPNNKVNKNTILKESKDISYFMFQSEDLGLELPMETAIVHLSPSIIETINVLSYSRIGRVGTGVHKKFSFIHRRFNEYFVAVKLLENENLLIVESIPKDSRWRDALVLYCEIAPAMVANKIAEYCCTNSIDSIDTYYKRRIKTEQLDDISRMHCLRFLSEAFKTRKDLLSVKDLNDLNEMISMPYRVGSNLLKYKLSIEAVSLLSDENIQGRVSEALRYRSTWITDTAINSCRHISNISLNLLARIILTFNDYSDYYFIINYYKLRFSFSLSSGFNRIHKYLLFRLISIFVFTLILLFIFLINPIILIGYLLLEILLPTYRWNLVDFFDIDEKETLSRLIILKAIGQKEFWLRICLLIGTFATLKIFPTIVSVSDIFTNPFFKLFLLIIVLLTYFDDIIFMFFIGVFKLRPAIINKPEGRIKGSLKQRISESFTESKKDFKVLQDQIRNGYKSDPKKWWKGFTLFILCIIGVMLLSIIIRIITCRTLWIILTCGLILVLLHYSIKYLKRYYHDKKILNQLLKNDKTEGWRRETIEHYYYIFKTSSFRNKFCNFLYIENIDVIGTWKKGLPNILGMSADYSNSMIAQLEERWLGLNR